MPRGVRIRESLLHISLLPISYKQGTFEVYSKIRTYSLTFEKENYYNAYFRGQIKTTDNVKAGIIHGRQQLQQVNTTLHYQLICTSGYTGMYCNIECNNGTCLLSNGTNGKNSK